MLDRLERRRGGEAVRELSGLPLDPYFSAGKPAWLLEHEPAVEARATPARFAWGPSTRGSRTSSGRGFATDPSTASRTQLSVPGAPDWDDALLDAFAVPRATLLEILDSAGQLGALRHPDWDRELPLRARVVDQQAALAGAGARARPCQGDLRHRGVRAGPRRRPPPDPSGAAWSRRSPGGWRSRSSTPRRRRVHGGALLEWLSRDLGLAEDPPALAALAADVEDSAGVRLLPALSGLGAPLVAPGRERRPVRADGEGPARASPAPRSRRSRGGSRTWWPPCPGRLRSAPCAWTAV